MKLLKIFILILFLSQKISSQNDIYFTKTLDTIPDKLLRLNYLDDIILKTKDTNLNLFTNSVESYINLAIELKKYEKAINCILTSFNTISYRHPEKANKLLFEVEKYKDKISNPYLLGGIFTKKAQINYSANNFDKAIENYTSAIQTYGNSNKDSLHIADAILFRGQAYVNIGLFLKSIEDYKLALVFYKNLNDVKYIYFCKTAIAKIYSTIGLHKKAIDEFLLIIHEKESKNYTVGLTSNYYNLAINYKKNGNKDKYRTYLFKALALKKTRNDNDGFLPYYEAEVAKYYIEKDSLIKAKEIIDFIKNVKK